MASMREGGVTVAPHGSWKSPITADIVAGADKRLGGIAVDGRGRLIWLESRPSEAGRSVLVREAEAEGKTKDVTPPGFNVRTLVHEYGGGAFTVLGDMVVFSNYQDQRLYKQSIKEDSIPVPLTPDYGTSNVCYADGVIDARLGHYITVREDHRESETDPKATIVSVKLDSKIIEEPIVLVDGSDFYSFPRLDPEGRKLAWIEWNHPDMSWDRAQLWVGYLCAEGNIERRVCVSGSDPNMIESPTEPKWSPQGELFFVTDRETGYWNLYKWVESDNKLQALHPMDAEFTRPAWVFGNCSYTFLCDKGHNNQIACTYRKNGKSQLGVLNYKVGLLSAIDLPFSDIKNITSCGCHLYIEAASHSDPLSIVKIPFREDLVTKESFCTMWSSSSVDISKFHSFLSAPEIIEFSTKVPGQNAFAYLYLPTNPNYKALEGEKPPLLLKCHGGPTAESRAALDLSIQYWTSRGWAFVDVNYGGSTGYGRAYRERLYGSWGIVDVDDCCSCAEFLVSSGKVDGHKLCITGKSAGGYTTLASLVFRNTFRAGASLYGVGDLRLLKADTHKFESHYIQKLVGNDESLYFERSPINFIERLSCPIILFQGLEDKVVPPEQAEKIYEAAKNKGLPVALIEYEGEQHGFRKAENIKNTLEQQMVFFARLVGNFKVADHIVPVPIQNID
eukprot:TRINITY_DN33129_c0_g1_i1.p1 TRINITY_DN33129_c0_g1~~TRINITY_DN33129_c0_g1_i1.p1  ORF type:complete len:740 (-),score=130.98 TRINITY_DN33129_c0_g1_i1:162-2186(-)